MFEIHSYMYYTLVSVGLSFLQLRTRLCCQSLICLPSSAPHTTSVLWLLYVLNAIALHMRAHHDCIIHVDVAWPLALIYWSNYRRSLIGRIARWKMLCARAWRGGLWRQCSTVLQRRNFSKTAYQKLSSHQVSDTPVLVQPRGQLT